MFPDQVLAIIGVGLLVLALLLLILLLRSRKRSSEYRRLLSEETEHVDIMTALMTQATAAQFLTRRTEPVTTDTQRTEFVGANPSGSELGLDLTPLEGKYELLEEIHCGGMSRIFRARHARLGNEWIVKYVDRRHAELANEAEVLKKLNHISLPQIIDIFQTGQGTFLVERYIEGFTLQQVLQMGQEIRESQIVEWGQQIAQALNYLHNLETPITHCDLKPSNIMVTHDNRLVLIDFGISRREGADDNPNGITYRYAAPEQFKQGGRTAEIAKGRFGSLPEGCADWEIDCRTDLFSAGVILHELATGDIPRPDQKDDLSEQVSANLAETIRKCIALDPKDRYQSAQELFGVLTKVQEHRLGISRSLVLRRVAGVAAVAAFVAGLASSVSAVYVWNQENLSLVSIDPGRTVVTAQQSVQVLIWKTKPNGDIFYLDPDQFQWSYSDDNIARMSGDHLVGINVGETTLYGQYRNKLIELQITVTEPVETQVDVALRYPDGTEVSVYAGTGIRETVDGMLDACAFVSPEDLFWSNGTLSVIDAGVIRFIEDDEVFTLPLEPEFLTASRVRCTENEVYVLTGPWEAGNGSYYGIIQIMEGGAEFLYYTDARWSAIPDFAFSSDGTLYFIQENMGTGATTLNTLDLDTMEPNWIMDLPYSTHSMAFDGADNLYLAVPRSGTILRVDAGEGHWTYFAGVEDEKHFIDGEIAYFYQPMSLAVDGNSLYILDFDTIRRVTVEGTGALFTETLAGEPTANTNPAVQLGCGGGSVLPASELATISVDGEGRVLLSDPKNCMIYEIKQQ